MKNEMPKQTILVVDDQVENIDVLSGILKEDYRIKVALNGRKGIQIAISDDPPDLILLDIMMPDIDGYEVCKCLKSNARAKKIPVIFVTAKGEVSDEAKGLAVGAVDYITKPISPPIVKARVKIHLALFDQNRALEDKVRERTRELNNTQDVTILSMTTLAEYRDSETGKHIMRTQRYVAALAEQLIDHPQFRHILDRDMIDILFKSAPLHDIGKIGVRDHVLLKPGRLTPEEFEIMKQHTIYGRDAIRMAEEALSYSGGTSFLRVAREIAYTHHEKWDGSGYPRGLRGEKIPLSGRLMAVADVYDALISKRVYKPAFSHEKAVSMMTQKSGTHFDPVILRTFYDIKETFRKIAQDFSDAK